MSKASMNSSRWRCTWCMGWVEPRNVDLQEYAPRICTKNMQQEYAAGLFPVNVLLSPGLETIPTLHSHAPPRRRQTLQSQIAKRGRTGGGLIGRQFEILKVDTTGQCRELQGCGTGLFASLPARRATCVEKARRASVSLGNVQQWCLGETSKG